MFFLAVLILAVLSALMVTWPLWRGRGHEVLSAMQLDRSVYEDRRAELDNDLRAGDLSAQEHAALVEELARTLLADERAGESAVAALHRHDRVWAAALSFALLLLGLAVYGAWLYDPALGAWWKVEALVGPDVDRVITGQAPQNSQSYGLPDFVRVLQTRVAADPERADLWAGLGMSYEQMHVPDIAALAFAHANQLHPGQVTIELALARAQIEANEGQLDIPTRDLLIALLKQSPTLLPAQLMLAEGSYNSGDYARAVPLYDAVLGAPDSGLDAADRTTLMAHRQDAAARAQADRSAARLQTRIAVTLDIPAAVRAAAACATLFVYAKAEQGPPMPLAVARFPLASAPAQVLLDDSMAMMPALRLSNFTQVKVAALISRHGQAKAQPGDWTCAPVVVSTLGEQQLHLRLDQAVP